jgi:hypothetical protein
VDALFQEESFFFPVEMTRIAADGDEEIVFEKDEDVLKEKYFCDELKRPVVSEFHLETEAGGDSIRSENIHFKSRTRRRGLLEIISGRSSNHPNPTRIVHRQRVKDEPDFDTYVDDCIGMFCQLQGSIGLLSREGDFISEDGNTIGGVPRFQRVTLLSKTYVDIFGKDRLFALPDVTTEEIGESCVILRYPGGFDQAVESEWVDQISKQLDREKKLFWVNLDRKADEPVEYLDLSEFIL